ncbi:hypothetical protein Cenrod_2093 [Candidatus Symbiobacter mobilis CR]|uniref:Uncharacterized protein n=1 Tax=Candidatus Symbiobacter mobilis CR TaxID=946483 RepID=U5NDB2_9BURK|nr:hypothetical protein Cenrod_2093 [Candidatus Symbiobacter mobilis CR]
MARACHRRVRCQPHGARCRGDLAARRFFWHLHWQIFFDDMKNPFPEPLRTRVVAVVFEAAVLLAIAAPE